MELKQARYYVHMRHFWLAQSESLLGDEKKSSHTQCFLSGQSEEHKTGNRNGNVFWKSQPWIGKLSFSEVKAQYDSVWGHYPLFNLIWKAHRIQTFILEISGVTDSTADGVIFPVGKCGRKAWFLCAVFAC